MSSPNLLSTAELHEDVVFDENSTVYGGLPWLEGPFKARDYQLEMLEESMRRNIIVAVLLPWSPFSRRLTQSRWIQGQARHLCIRTHSLA